MKKKPIIGRSLPATTTAQEDVVTAGQRRINIIWEITQAIIAMMITISVTYCQIRNINADELYYAFFLIVSMYFIRTNHQLIGGTGAKPKNQHR